MSYAILKALHLFGAFAWIAAAWYLPRILIYHRESVDIHGENKALQATLITMAGRLLKYIMMPAMAFTLVFGLVLVGHSTAGNQPWFHVKLLGISILIAYSLVLARLCRQFRMGKYIINSQGLRWLNEVPTFILVAILFATVVYPQL